MMLELFVIYLSNYLFRVPSSNFTVSDAKKCVGSRRIIDVMDVMTQKGETMSMKEYVQYYEDIDNRERLLNVISLEFSCTKLENYVEQPKVVSDKFSRK